MLHDVVAPVPRTSRPAPPLSFLGQGTSDPVVYVEAFGQRFATEVKQACISCVFDETFVISLRNLDKDVFRESQIKYVYLSKHAGHIYLYVYRTPPSTLAVDFEKRRKSQYRSGTIR